MSDSGSAAGTHILLGAARHHHRQAQQLSFCPEAQSALQEKSKQLFQQALNARPLAEQVTILEKEYMAKVEQSKALMLQIEALNGELAEVDTQGADLEQKLGNARSRLAAVVPAPVPAQPMPTHLVALGQVEEMAPMLSPEAAAPFAACLGLLRQFLVAQQGHVPQVPVAQGLPCQYTPQMAAQPAAAPPMQMSFASVAQAAAPPAQVAPAPAPVHSAPASSLGGPSNVVVSARKARTRERETWDDMHSESELGDFVPIRSRSAPGVRIRAKTTQAEVLVKGDTQRMATAQAREEFLDSGARYFSQKTERAGLDV
jgi:hypothetical protein